MRTRCWGLLLSVLVAAFLVPAAGFGQGAVLPGVGAINRSMAGTGVAAPLDAAGAIHWNPASLSGLESSEFVIGAELLYLSNTLSSTVPIGPDMTLSGSTHSDSGVGVLPTVAVAFKRPDSAWSYGLGMFGIGGFTFNYPGDPNNPILSGLLPGTGPVYSKLAILQIAPTAAYQVTDQLSIGFAPTVSLADASLDPAVLTSPNPNGYPPATHGRTFWGLGFQAGIYYDTCHNWRLGASYKSPQWFEDFTFYSTDGFGLPREFTLDMDYPAIISVGASYYGIPRLLWAFDLRYVDYANADGLGDATGYGSAGQVTGLGWQSVFAASTGVQYQLTDALSLRLGYLFTENPIQDADTFYNIGSSAIYQHMISVGATLRITCRTSLSLAYLKAFQNEISGPFQLPEGPLPGSSVTARQNVDALVAGLEVRF